MHEKASNPVSRREFVKAAGLVVGGAAGGAAITYSLVPRREITKEVPVVKEVIKEVPKEVIKEVPTAAVYEVLPPYGKATMIVSEPPETTIVFKGTFEEVLNFYREKMWSDGLPIVPPTVEKVEEFLKYTDYPADAELTRPLPPSYRIGTPWWVAVNGVMAGCRPEYMPVLIAMTNAWAEPGFRSQDVNSTTGCTPITIINGARLKTQLGINYRQSYGHPGYQSNTSMGRFWTMYKRNLMEIRIEPPTDMAAHGMNYLNLAGEDDALCEEYGWKTLAEERGFQAEDSVVSTMSVLCQSEAAAIVGVSGEELLDGICGQICEGACCQWRLFTGEYLFVIPKVVADVLARDGFDKDGMRDFLYKNARRTAGYLETRLRTNQEGYYCQQVKDGKLPQMFCESEDPNRLVPIFADPAKIFFIVNGDRARNRVVCFMSNGSIGPMTSMRIELPENWWGGLYDPSQLREDLLNSGREFL